MAKLVLKDAFIEINSVDLSDHVRSVTVNMTKQLKESTGMGADGVERLTGLADDSFQITLAQDFAASEVDATLWAVFDAGNAFTVKVRPTSAVVGPTNPEYSGSVLLESYPPVGGDVGSLAETSITLPVNGKIARATA